MNIKTVALSFAFIIAIANFEGADLKLTELNTSKPIVTFIDDDCTTLFLTNLEPICADKNIKITLSWITSKTGQPGYGGVTYMTLDQLNQVAEKGYEIVSHTDQHNHLNIETDAELEADMKISHDILKANGFNADVIVYPFGLEGTYAEKLRTKNAASKYYKYGVDCLIGGDNPKPIDNYCVYRQSTETLGIDGLKDVVDQCQANNSWLIFLTHSGGECFDAKKVSELIDYIKLKGIDIMTFGEAEKIKCNALDFNNCNAPVYRIIYNQEDMDIPIKNYAINKETIVECAFAVPDCENQAGVMKVYRGGNHFSYALFYSLIYGNGNVYKRNWDDYALVPAWDTWEKIGV